MAATIFALASGGGRAAVAVIRISGPGSRAALLRMAGRCPAPRRLAVAAIRDPETGALLDRGMVAWFPKPASFTGEDAAEFQVHGSRAVVAAVLAALGRLPDCRLAHPGEFTQRAFGNGKLDLGAVEGLADLIDAETDAQRRQALNQLDGALGRWVGDLRIRLLDALALAEAAIDFVDEGDVAADALEQARAASAAVAARIRAERARQGQGERVRDGFTIALAGPPNAGKSTLLNALVGRDAALVSPLAGTTRDAIEVAVDLGGFAVVVVDTAGLRETADPLERAGIDRARARAANADLVLWLQDAGTRPVLPASHGWKAVLTVRTKIDAGAEPSHGFDVALSARTGDGLPGLLARLQSVVGEALTGGETALVTRTRHHQALGAALAALGEAERPDTAVEIVAEHLRAANQALGTLVGPIATEEVLGAIFARFCLGK